MTPTRRLARPLLASGFVWGGVQAMRNAQALGPKSKVVNDQVRDVAGKVAPTVSVPADDATLVRVNAAVQVVAGLGLATDRAPRLCALVLAGSLVPTTVAGHPFWNEKDKTARATQATQFFKNLSMLGGLVIAGIDNEGRPGVTWRAGNAVGTARRGAKSLRKQAVLTAKNATP